MRSTPAWPLRSASFPSKSSSNSSRRHTAGCSAWSGARTWTACSGANDSCTGSGSTRTVTTPSTPRPCGPGVPPKPLAERKAEGLDTGVEKLDLEPTVIDGSLLADELIHPLLGDGAAAVRAHVGAVHRSRGLAVEQD